MSGQPRRLVGIAGVVGQFRATDDPAQGLPLPVVFDPDGDPAILSEGGVDAVRGEVPVTVAGRTLDAAVDGVVQQGRTEKL